MADPKTTDADPKSAGYQSCIVMTHRNPDGSLRNRYTVEYFGLPKEGLQMLQKATSDALLALGEG